MQSSKRHYSWHTLGTRLCHKYWITIISSRFRDGSVDPSWPWYPISKDLKLCLFTSFHGLFPYDALRAKLVIWFQAPVTCIASMMLVASLCHRRGISGFIWLQPVHACCTPCPVDPRKKLGVKIKHLIGQNHEPLLLGCTKLFDPSAKLIEIVWNCIILSHVGNNLVLYCWEASSYHWLVFALPVCIVDWPDILRRILGRLKKNNLPKDIFCCLLCCWLQSWVNIPCHQ